MNEVLNAMFEKKVQRGDVIIKQGDDGDNFYVIERFVAELVYILFSTYVLPLLELYQYWESSAILHSICLLVIYYCNSISCLSTLDSTIDW